MQIQTVLFLVLAFIFALGFAVYQYRRSKTGLKLRILLPSLRFLMLFGGFLLLINPEFVQNSYYTEKSSLTLLVDESSSITEATDASTVQNIIGELKANEEIRSKYALQAYVFDKTLRPLDSLHFDGKATDITNGLNTIKQTYSNSKNRIVLVSDGNQTYGQDYSFFDIGQQSQIDAVVVGDTTSYQDLGIGTVNSNRYGFLDNQFPLEAQLYYTGTSNISTTAKITLDERVVLRETVAFSNTKRSYSLRTNIKAPSTGVKTIKVELSALTGEKNIENNTKEIAIEIIDEKTVVGIVSSVRHPDIGALKKAIESNEQREVVLLEPTITAEQLEKIDVFVLYQPSSIFERVFEHLKNRGSGVFIITGTQTDWNYLNDKIQGVTFEGFGENEEILPVKNDAFDLFDLASFDTKIFPPLKSELGELNFTSEPKVIANQQIRGVRMETPLFFILEDDNKYSFLLGENVWKWRLNTYRNTNSFAPFDDFVAKLVLYLSNSEKKERLQLDYENVFENSSEAQIRATFYNKAYEIDKNAKLSLNVKGENGFQREIPMLLSGNQFTANLSDLEEGIYTFVVTEAKERISRSGQFKILDFDLEKQFITANDDKLKSLAENNSGRLFYPDQLENLVDELITDTGFVPVQKSTKKVVSLIDFRIVLGIMALALALEWFIRKYNGLL